MCKNTLKSNFDIFINFAYNVAPLALRAATEISHYLERKILNKLYNTLHINFYTI